MSICVYKLLCTANKRFYIGSTIDYAKRKERHLRDLRSGSHNNIFLQRTFNKYGEGAFKWKVIYVDTKDEARALEQHYIDKYMQDKRCMNIGKTASGGDNLSRNPRRDSIVSQMASTMRERIARMTEEERKAKWGHSGASNGMYGRTHTEDTRKKLRECNLGRASKRRGIPLSEEHRRKVSAARMGRFTGADNPFYGKRHTPETKRHLSELSYARAASPDYTHPQARRVNCDGKVYTSVSAAARALGCVPASILFRIKSPNFNYAYL